MQSLVAFAHWGRQDNRLLAQCSPDCPDASVAHLRKLYLAADVSLGVGIVSLIAATWAAASAGPAKETGNRAAYLMEVTPGRSGAVATVSGRF
jgi:hypothetical protein